MPHITSVLTIGSTEVQISSRNSTGAEDMSGASAAPVPLMLAINATVGVDAPPRTALCERGSRRGNAAPVENLAPVDTRHGCY